MKKVIGSIFIVIALFVLMGCMTANQLAAEKAYYEMVGKVVKQQSAQPIFKITPSKEGEPMVFNNVRSIEVFSPPPALGDFAKQYQHRDFTPPIIGQITQALMPLGALYGGSLLLREANQGGNTSTYNQTVSGTGNSAQVRTMDVGNVTGTNTLNSLIDRTSTPTVVVVEQPTPIIVTP